MGENIHLRIAARLQNALSSARAPVLVHRLQRELRYEQKSARQPSQGMWILTDLGMAINPAIDIRQNPALLKRQGFSEAYRRKLERRGAELINTKVPHILHSLTNLRHGGATTGELLEDTYFTTSSELYGTLNRLRGDGKNRKKVTVKNKTVGYFKWLLSWPAFEPIIKLVKYQPSPDSFQYFAGQYETLGAAVHAATRFGFTVDHQVDMSNINQYIIPLPEEISGGQLQYDPLRTNHVARFTWGRHQELSAAVTAKGKSRSIDPAALEQLIQTHGERFFQQRLDRARLYRQAVGLR